jgi:hypothetical protein
VDAIGEAMGLVKESLPLALDGELGSAVVAMGMQHIAIIATLDRRFELAARLAGYAESFFSAEFQGHTPTELQSRERLMDGLRDAMAPDTLSRRMAEGATWSEDQAMAAALAA